MVKYLTLAVGDYQSNCYIVYNEETSFVIDPGDDFKLIDDILKREKLSPSAILLTHGHFDHVGAVKQLKDKYDCLVYMNSYDNHLLSFMRTSDFDIDFDLKNSKNVSIGSVEVECVSTPGHSEGSMCYLIGNLLFTGDTLFKGSIGRCDLPGGSSTTMINTLSEIISNMDNSLTVLPGHGEMTTIAKEKTMNYYLKNL